MENTIDPLTKEQFRKKRANQKFANAANRIRYNNDRANTLRRKLAYIEKPLRKNFTILNELMNGKKEEVFHKQFLIGKGFSFTIFNHYSSIEDKRHPSVYNFAIIALSEDKIKIIKQ